MIRRSWVPTPLGTIFDAIFFGSSLHEDLSDNLSETCIMKNLNGSERRALDLNGCGPGYTLGYTHWGNILMLDIILFSQCKASDANIAIIVNSVCS